MNEQIQIITFFFFNDRKKKKKKWLKKQLRQNQLSEHDIFPAAMAIENQL